MLSHCNLNVAYLFDTKNAIIEPSSLTIFVTAYFLAFSKFGLDSDVDIYDRYL